MKKLTLLLAISLMAVTSIYSQTWEWANHFKSSASGYVTISDIDTDTWKNIYVYGTFCDTL